MGQDKGQQIYVRTEGADTRASALNLPSAWRTRNSR